MTMRTDRAFRTRSACFLCLAAGSILTLSACSSGVDPVLRDAQARLHPTEPIGVTGATGGSGHFEPFAVSSSGVIGTRTSENDSQRIYQPPAKSQVAAANVTTPALSTLPTITSKESVRTTPPAPAYPTAASAPVVASKPVQTPPPIYTQASMPAEQMVASATPRPAPVQNESTRVSETVMAKAMRPGAEAAGSARGAAVNVVQVSFALEGADFDPDVSTDGNRIVFASTQHRPTADIYIKNVEGRTVTQLTTDPANDIMPRISPDGTRVAFASDRSGIWNIYVMPITGGRAIQVTSSSADDLHPSWSPDGTQLVFSRMGQMSGQWEMWVTDVANSGISKFIGYGLFPEWCPAAHRGPTGGDLIAYQKSRERGDRSFGLWTLEFKDGQAGNTTEIASSPNAACINPTWSRDGQWLAYSTVPNASAWAAQDNARPAQADLWMVDLSGSNRINLTSGLAINLMPRFGLDNRLFFVSDRGGTDNVWVMDTTPVMKLAALNGTPTNTGYAAKPVAPQPKSTTVPEVAGAHDDVHKESPEHGN